MLTSKFLSLLLTIASFGTTSFAFTQSISGIWVGNSETTGTIADPTKIELEIQQITDSSFTGVTHLYYNKGEYEHHKISGFFRKSDSFVKIIEDSVIGYKYNKHYDICEGIYEMTLYRSGS